MQPFGTVPDSDGNFSYFVSQNDKLIMQPLHRTTVAPFGTPQVNMLSDTAMSEYATLRAALAFAAALQSHGAIGIAMAEEGATFVTDLNGEGVPKWEITFADRRVNAGVIASILGNDPAYGYTVEVKAGHLAQALGEEWNDSVHIPLMKAIVSAATPLAK